MSLVRSPISGIVRGAVSGIVLSDDFLPNQIANLGLWLDAGLSPNTLNSGNVAQENDLSGNARNAAQGTAANQPALTANSINGLPAAVFDGTNDYLAIASYLMANATNSTLTLFLVAKSNRAAAASALMGTRNLAGTKGWLLRYENPTTLGYYHLGATGNAALTVTDQNNVIGVRRNGNDATIGVNNVWGTTKTFTGYTPTDATTTVIGNDGESLSNPHQGPIAAVIAYDRNLTDAEATRVYRYLGARYGIAQS